MPVRIPCSVSISMGGAYEIRSSPWSLIPFIGWVVGAALTGASYSTYRSIYGGDLNERPSVAILHLVLIWKSQSSPR